MANLLPRMMFIHRHEHCFMKQPTMGNDVVAGRSAFRLFLNDRPELPKAVPARRSKTELPRISVSEVGQIWNQHISELLGSLQTLKETFMKQHLMAPKQLPWNPNSERE